MSKKVADIIIETLQAAGVKHCYGIVGDTLNHIAHSMEKSDIEWVHVRHEEAGAFAAQTEATQTGNLTAIAGSCGPGSLHFINGVVEANRNRAPVILIASQIVRDELGFEFPQEIDFKEIYKSCSIYCDMILTPEQARRKTTIACQTALTKRGVAVLIVPVDVSIAETADDVPYSVHVSHGQVRPSDENLHRIAEILNEGGKIAIYGGSGCEGALPEMLAVSERLMAPIGHTSRGKNFVEPGNPYNIGMTGFLGSEAGYRAILDCDTLLLLGADFAWRQYYPDKAKIVQIDIDPTHIGRRHPVTLGLVGDIKTTLQALLPLLKQQDDPVFRDDHVKRHTQLMKEMHEKAVPARDGSIPPTYLTELINQHAADDALFTADDGTPTAWMYRFIEIRGSRRVYSSLLHGTMAGAMPGALGLQKCQPGRQVISLSGDGGLSMLFGDLMTTIQEDLPIKVVVYDNGRLGFIELEQKSEGLMNVYTHLKNPDFGRVAEAMGLWGRTVNKADELEEAIRAWLAQPGPALLNVRVNPMQMINPPHIEIDKVYGMALYSVQAILHGRGDDVWELVKENYL